MKLPAGPGTAAVDADDAVGDGEAQAGATGRAVAIVGDTIERLEDVDELGLGNALSVIADEKADEAGRVRRLKLHVYGVFGY